MSAANGELKAVQLEIERYPFESAVPLNMMLFELKYGIERFKTG